MTELSGPEPGNQTPAEFAPIRFLKVESLPYEDGAYSYRVTQRCYPVGMSVESPTQIFRCTRILLERRAGQLMLCVYAMPDTGIGLEGEREIAALNYAHIAICWVHPEDRDRWRDL